MDSTIVPLQKIDTVLNADSVEFCPYENQEHILLCGTYKLQEETNQEITDEDANQLEATPCEQTRLGGISVFSLSSHEGKNQLLKASQFDTCGVLDIKWPGSRIRGKSLFGFVDAEGFLQIFNLPGDGNVPIVVDKKSLSESSLGLSLGWDGGRDRVCSNVVCSDSKGCLTAFHIADSELSVLSTWQAHEYEAWIAAYHNFDSNIVYSGGDDCRLKGWDLRDTTRPTFVCKRHSMGVCSIQSHPFLENIYAIGSYDEELLIWDRRSQRQPLAYASLGGGIWRIKWDPFTGKNILTATMYNGTHIVSADTFETNPLPVVAEYKDHNLAYGADWCCLDTSLSRIPNQPGGEDSCAGDSFSYLISTCSFYDHSLHLWEWTKSKK